MEFRMIKPPDFNWRTDRPSLYRACVLGNKKEFDECEAKIMKIYWRANEQNQQRSPNPLPITPFGDG